MLLVGLTVPHTSTAQSIWSSPFDSGPEDEEDTYSTWGTPNDASTYSNPWGSDEEDDDSWGYNPWDTSYDDPWDSSSNSSGGSDWSSDFYDFDDENSSSSGSADRVGDGVMMNNSFKCLSNDNCGGAGGNALCCINSEGTASACSNNAGNCTGGDAGDLNGGTPIEDPDSPDPIPVDGALLYLVIIGVAYGAYKLRGL